MARAPSCASRPGADLAESRRLPTRLRGTKVSLMDLSRTLPREAAEKRAFRCAIFLWISGRLPKPTHQPLKYQTIWFCIFDCSRRSTLGLALLMTENIFGCNRIGKLGGRSLAPSFRSEAIGARDGRSRGSLRHELVDFCSV